jgi:hypothetical protein
VVSPHSSEAVVEIVEGDTLVAVWPIEGLRPDLLLVDALARLQLEARRMGWSMRLRHPGAELRGLLHFVGLADLVAVADVGDIGDIAVPAGNVRRVSVDVAGTPDGSDLPFEAGREAEGGKQLGVEEMVERDDPSL